MTVLKAKANITIKNKPPMTDETDPGIVQGKSFQMAIPLTRRQNMLLVRPSLEDLYEKS